MSTKKKHNTSLITIGLWGFIACTGSILGYYIFSHASDIIGGGNKTDSMSMTKKTNRRLTTEERRRQAEEIRKSMAEKEKELTKKYSSKKETNTDDSKTNAESRRDWEKKKDQIKKHLTHFKNQPDAPAGSIKANLQNQLRQLNSDKPSRY